MKIAIITAMPGESRAILGKAEQVQRSRQGDRRVFRCRMAAHDVTMVEAGMGMLNAGWAATMLAGERPDLLLSAGFGGGVLPGLKVGDAVMAEGVLQCVGNGFERVETTFYGDHNPALPPRGVFIT
ncbi:MAG TPA: hypothetical protein VF795_11590, partial [Desulfuromonadaceae bacterium]